MIAPPAGRPAAFAQRVARRRGRGRGRRSERLGCERGDGRLSQAAAADYRTVTEAALSARDADARRRRRTAARLRRALDRIENRDFFPPPERKAAKWAVDELVALVETDA